MHAFRPLVALTLIGVLCLPVQANAATSLAFTTSILADTTTGIPGGTGSFVTFDPNLALSPVDPCVSDGNLGFWGAGSGGQQGVYGIVSGVLTRVADLSSPIPDGTGTFTGFTPSDPCNSGTNFVFQGSGSNAQQGVYRCQPSDPCRIADTTTAIPGGSGTFVSFGLDSLSGTNEAFVGNGSGSQGVDRCIPTDPCRVVADTSTAIPSGTGLFTGFDQPRISGTNAAFLGFGSSAQSGVYVCTPGDPCRVLVNATTTIPSGSGTFNTFTAVALDGTSTAFVGGNSTTVCNADSQTCSVQYSQQGVYVSVPPNPIMPVANFSSAVPGGVGTFSHSRATRRATVGSDTCRA
jgi:hypothetical protein